MYELVFKIKKFDSGLNNSFFSLIQKTNISFVKNQRLNISLLHESDVLSRDFFVSLNSYVKL